MNKRPAAVTFMGNPLTLLGEELKVGEKAPAFTALSTDLKPFSLSDLDGTVRVLVSVPSVDTPVCAAETRRFNEEAAKLSDDVKIVTISMDLPFALGRFCAAEGIDAVTAYSDHNMASFGHSYGVLIEELRLLARSVFVVDKQGTIRYVELVKEVAEEPNYDAVLKAVKDLV